MRRRGDDDGRFAALEPRPNIARDRFAEQIRVLVELYEVLVHEIQTRLCSSEWLASTACAGRKESTVARTSSGMSGLRK